MRAIAESIEYSPTVIYQYFRDKEALVRELCIGDFLHLSAELADTGQSDDPVQRLIDCGLAYARFAVAYPNHYRLMFMDPLPLGCGELEMPEHKGMPEYDAYALLLSQVKSATTTGRLRNQAADPELIAQTLWAGIHGVLSLEIAMNRADDRWIEWRPLQERVRIMLEALIAGLFEEGR